MAASTRTRSWCVGYFDGDDLVDVDKTVVRGALDPKKKITVQKLIDALTESVDF